MKTQTIFRIHRKENFAIISKDILTNPTLSFKAKGIMAYLLSLPPDWTVNVADIANRSTDQEYAIRSGIRELIEAGYIVRRAERDERGRVTRWVLEVHEAPVREGAERKGEPDRGFLDLASPDRGFPDRGFLDVENLDHTNKESYKVRIEQKKESLTAALINSGQQNFSAAAGVKSSEPSPQPAPKTGDWNLESLARLNLVSRRKIAEMRKAGTTPRAFAEWVAEAYRKIGLSNPIGYAVQNAIEYPQGRNLAAFARGQAELLDWLAKAIAGYPLDDAPDIAAMLRGISQADRRSMFLALGGNEDDIPTAYVPPAPEILPAKPEELIPVELPDFVIKKHQEILARSGGR